MADEIYTCSECKAVLERLAGMPCTDMQPLQPKTEDKGSEKHVPVIKVSEGEYEVVVGEVEHPMEEDHYIEWIEIYDEDNLFRKRFKPGDKPVAGYKGRLDGPRARIYCNVHGLWSS